MNFLPENPVASAKSSKGLPLKRSIQQIVDPRQLTNTKFKRTRNLVKKSLEVSIQCELDIVMLVYDRRYNRFREICTNPDLTIDRFKEMT